LFKGLFVRIFSTVEKQNDERPRKENQTNLCGQNHLPTISPCCCCLASWNIYPIYHQQIDSELLARMGQIMFLHTATETTNGSAGT
jgi:hypothetical protein